MIVGLAGHIDHGKTALVRALTGVDTDRLPEEKRRGITIELGFAPLTLPELGVVGLIDVPGHEGLVRTMLAGATGIDVGLLVIAADEGPMPQTLEHLSILSLLGVRELVVALTKCDTVDDEWLLLAADDVSGLLQRSGFGNAPTVATAAPTGRGIDQLRATLGAALARARSAVTRPSDDLFRMPIDRAFIVKGTGLVATGTVWSGRADLTSALRLFPGARPVRVRSIRTFGMVTQAAEPGHRTAFALSGAQASDVVRGGWLVGEGAWTEAALIHAEVDLRVARPLGPREWARLHLGTTDIGARIVFSDRETNGGPRAARVVLDEPLLARGGDRFVLRRASPPETIGGGIVTDPAPTRRRSKPSFGAAAGPEERMEALVAEAGLSGVPVDSLSVRLGIPPALVRRHIEGSLSLRRIGTQLVSSRTLDHAAESVVMEVDRYLTARHFERGVPRAALTASTPFPAEIVDHAVTVLVQSGRLQIMEGLVALAGWVPAVTGADAKLRSRVHSLLDSAAMEPPTVSELKEMLSADPLPVLRHLEREGDVVPVEAGRYYAKSALDRAVARMKQEMEPGREYSPAELREILGSTRKYLIPFLEYCDRHRITERLPGGRVLRAG